MKASTSGNQLDVSLNQSRLNQASSGSRRRVLDDFDDMDLEFDAPSAANNNNGHDDLDFDDDLGESQESDEAVSEGGMEYQNEFNL